MAFSNPTIANFKDFFDRGFPYEPDPLPEGADQFSYVRDKDIQKAIDKVDYQINDAFFSSQKEYSDAFLNATAHFMIMDLRAQSQGVSDKYEWLSSSSGVGSISESRVIPDYIAQSLHFSFFTTTTFGLEYALAIYEKSRGTIFTVRGGTSP